MDKIFIDRLGKIEKYSTEPDRRRHMQFPAGKTEKYSVKPDRRSQIRFPVCLSIRRSDYEPTDCLDFVLNASKGDLFIRTSLPSPKGSKMMIHFYIPPDTKLLGEFEGEVVELIHGPPHSRGMHVKIINSGRDDIQRLEEYLEEKRHLFYKVI